MKITFYKDNKLGGRFQKSVSQILTEFYKTDDSKLDMPFERKLLNFMVQYGSFGKISQEQWNAFRERIEIYEPELKY